MEARNENIREVIDVMCAADAITGTCNVCVALPPGLDAAELLLALQTAYPATGWTATLVTTTTAYMRNRGMMFLVGTDYYLNYNMAKLGGPNIVFATGCPKLLQVPQCSTVQYSKYGTSCGPPVECTPPDPAAGCCPPQVAP